MLVPTPRPPLARAAGGPPDPAWPHALLLVPVLIICGITTCLQSERLISACAGAGDRDLGLIWVANRWLPSRCACVPRLQGKNAGAVPCRQPSIPPQFPALAALVLAIRAFIFEPFRSLRFDDAQPLMGISSGQQDCLWPAPAGAQYKVLAIGEPQRGDVGVFLSAGSAINYISASWAAGIRFGSRTIS